MKLMIAAALSLAPAAQTPAAQSETRAAAISQPSAVPTPSGV